VEDDVRVDCLRIVWHRERRAVGVLFDAGLRFLLGDGDL
jgi:hypothetical protein